MPATPTNERASHAALAAKEAVLRADRGSEAGGRKVHAPDAARPEIGLERVVGPVALEPGLAGRPFVAEGQADDDDVVFALHDHAALHGEVAGVAQRLSVGRRKRQL